MRNLTTRQTPYGSDQKLPPRGLLRGSGKGDLVFWAWSDLLARVVTTSRDVQEVDTVLGENGAYPGGVFNRPGGFVRGRFL